MIFWGFKLLKVSKKHPANESHTMLLLLMGPLVICLDTRVRLLTLAPLQETGATTAATDGPTNEA